MRIGVLRELSDFEIEPEIKSLFEKAIADLDSLGAEIIDPFVVPNFAELRRNQWCPMFRTDLEDFLATYVKRDTLQTLEDVIRIGTNSDFSRVRLESSANAEIQNPCLNAYEDPNRIAFREAIEAAMDSLNLDAIIYPSWNKKPARINHYMEDYGGDNNQIIAPHTGQPAFTVPMGFGYEGLPAGIQFLGRMYSEPTLIKIAYGYEQGTLHRRPPNL